MLTVESAGTSTSGSSTSYIDGPIAKVGTAAFVFPVGDGTKWARVGIGAPSSSSTFTAEYIATGYSNTTAMATNPTPVLDNVSVNQYWQLDRTAGTGDATVTLYWENATADGISDCTNLRVAHWNSVISKWENNNDACSTTGSCSGTSSGTVVTTAVVSSFSPFTFGNKQGGVSSLPIELLSFTGNNQGSTNLLEWTTTSEINNDYFTLERSLNASNFETVGIVDGAGNSTIELNYKFTDSQISNFTNQLFYYRLKQTDFDAHFTYSDIVMVNMDKNNDLTFDVFPNPNTGSAINILISVKNTEEVLVVVSDVLGKESYSKVIISGENNSDIYAIDPTNKLTPGVYMITASSKDTKSSKRLIVQ